MRWIRVHGLIRVLTPLVLLSVLPHCAGSPAGLDSFLMTKWLQGTKQRPTDIFPTSEKAPWAFLGTNSSHVSPVKQSCKPDGVMHWWVYAWLSVGPEPSLGDYSGSFRPNFVSSGSGRIQYWGPGI